MIIVKITIILWVVHFILNFLFKSTLSIKDKIRIALGEDIKVTPFMVFFTIEFLIAVIGTLASIIWFLFVFL